MFFATFTRYLTLKYPLIDERVGTIHGDQQVACEFYLSCLETSKEELVVIYAHPFEVINTYFEGWDPILGAEAERLTPIVDFKEVQIGPHIHQVMKIGTSLYVVEECELVDRL